MEENLVDKIQINEQEIRSLKTETNKNNVENSEESLTPPLLPNMIVAPGSNSDKKVEKDKGKRMGDWDMFAEQDIFKANTHVCRQIL